MMIKLSIVIAMGLAAFAQTTPTSKAAVPKKAPAATGTSAQEDKQIEAALHAKLEKSKIGKDGIKVHVQGGDATWEETPSVLQHKGAAARMAKTAGAKVVVNHVKVSDAAKEKA